MTIQLRQGTTAQWGASSRILLPGEIGVEFATDGGPLVAIKAGDGTHLWGALLNLAVLDSTGKIPIALLPDLALIQFGGTKANQAAMLATTGQLGDWVIRSDTSTAWIITGSDPTQLASWTQLPFPSITWSNIPGKPAFVAAGADALSARAAIGAAPSKAFYVDDYLAVPNAVVTTGGMTAGAATLTKTSGSFTSADVGKVAVVQYAGATRTVADAAITTGTAVLTSATAAFTSADVRSRITITGAGAAGATLTATIVKVSSATTITISTNASTTVSGATIKLFAYLTTTIASVASGVATLAANAGSTVSAVNVLFGTDSTTAIAAAMSAAAVAGGIVILSAGNYIVTAALVPAHNVAVLGFGAGVSNMYLAGTSAFAGFYRIGSTSDRLTRFTLSDMTIDGQYMQQTFNVGNKGVFITHVSAGTFRNLVIQNTLASGLGIDFLVDGTLIHNVRAYNCGAGSWGGSNGGGSSGIGIGVGANAVEEFTISDCHTKNNGIYGIFIETQDGNMSRGAKIIGCTAVGNQVSGFADCGGIGTIWADCVAYGNVVDGFTNCGGTVSGSVPGQDTIWSDCVSWGNGSHGFAYTPVKFGNSGTQQLNPTNTIRVSHRGCKAVGNGTQGFYVNTATSAVVDTITYDHCEAYLNGSSGLIFTGSGSVKNAVINGGSYFNNGTISATDHFGMRANCNMTSLNIKGTKCFDNQTTQTQTHALALSSGFTITGLTVSNNDFRGNLTGPYSGGATLAAPLAFRNNWGYNPVGASVPGTAFALPASTVAWTNVTGVDVTLHVTAAGTVTAVSLNGVAISGTMAVGMHYPVPAGGTFAVTYSAAPTLVAVGN